MCIHYNSTPPHAFISRLNRFLEENKPPGFEVVREWDQEPRPLQPSPPKRRRRVPPGPSGVAPKGYKGLEFPILGGEHPCDHCKCTPCVIELPPDFLVGASAAHIRNKYKRYPLYRQFWSFFEAIGLWRHPEYLQKKEQTTVRDDQREILPSCVVKVSVNYNRISSISRHCDHVYVIPQEVRKCYPNPPGLAYVDYSSTFDGSEAEDACM